MGQFDPPSLEVQEFMNKVDKDNELSKQVGPLYTDIVKYVPELGILDRWDNELTYDPAHNRWFKEGHMPGLPKYGITYYEALIIGNCIKLLPECCWFNDSEANDITVTEISDISWGPPYAVKAISGNKHLVLALLEAVKWNYRQRWTDKDTKGDKCL